MTAPQIARSPIQLPQAVENRALDTVFGIARKCDLLIGIEFAGRIEETKNTRMNQIIQVDVHGQVFMHSHGDGFDQRKMLEDDAIALGRLALNAGTILSLHQISPYAF